MSAAGPPIRLFSYRDSRSTKTALELYEGARGALVTDGYEVYGGVAHANDLTHLGCWAHARRRFVGAGLMTGSGVLAAMRHGDLPTVVFASHLGHQRLHVVARRSHQLLGGHNFVLR